MTAYSVESGDSANWTLQPPSTPSARMIASAALRSRWWTWSVSVWTGATTIESPVWTPSGSTFSIEHTAMHVSSASRMTSYSISCQPTRQRSIITCLIGLARRPERTRSQYASSVSTMPPPVPPSVNAGRMIAGRPISASAASAEAWRASSSGPSTMYDGAYGWSIRSRRSRNASRSSAMRIASSGVPSSRTSCRSSTPASASAVARLSAVWPPSPASRPSGFSRAMTASIASTVRGSR